MSAFLLLPKYEQAMTRIQELERKLGALEEINQYLRDDIVNLKMHATRPNISIIGLRDDTRYQFSLEILDIQAASHDLVITVQLPSNY